MSRQGEDNSTGGLALQHTPIPPAALQYILAPPQPRFLPYCILFTISETQVPVPPTPPCPVGLQVYHAAQHNTKNTYKCAYGNEKKTDRPPENQVFSRSRQQTRLKTQRAPNIFICITDEKCNENSRAKNNVDVEGKGRIRSRENFHLSQADLLVLPTIGNQPDPHASQPIGQRRQKATTTETLYTTHNRP